MQIESAGPIIQKYKTQLTLGLKSIAEGISSAGVFTFSF